MCSVECLCVVGFFFSTHFAAIFALFLYIVFQLVGALVSGFNNNKKIKDLFLRIFIQYFKKLIIITVYIIYKRCLKIWAREFFFTHIFHSLAPFRWCEFLYLLCSAWIFLSLSLSFGAEKCINYRSLDNSILNLLKKRDSVVIHWLITHFNWYCSLIYKNKIKIFTRVDIMIRSNTQGKRGREMKSDRRCSHCMFQATW